MYYQLEGSTTWNLIDTIINPNATRTDPLIGDVPAVSESWDGASGDTKWYTYTVALPAVAKQNNTKIKIEQPRANVSGANDNDAETDHYGIAEIIYWKEKVTELVFVPSAGAISKPAVDTFGADTFLGMNEIGGGTNKPSTINNIQFAAGGGMIGKKKISTKPNKFKLPFFNMQSLRKNKVENREKPPVGMTSRSYNNVSVGNVGNRYTNNYKMISQNIMKSNSYPVNYSPNQNYSQLQLTSGSRVNMMIPGPLPSGSSSSFIPLPDIVQSLPPKQMGVNDGTKIPEFIGSPFSDKASINAGIYGIV